MTPRKSGGGSASSASQGPPKLVAPRGEVEKELQAQVAKGRDLAVMPMRTKVEYDDVHRQFIRWSDYNHELLRRRFSTEELATDYRNRTRNLLFAPQTLEQEMSSLRRSIESHVNVLESIRERLSLFSEERAPAPIAVSRIASQANTIFLVHGHNDGRKHEVARFLGQVTDLEIQILHEKPDQGRTILDKFEDYAGQAAFAVVVATGDDEGRVVGGGELALRPRQNVVFEIGFFFGSLGRQRVAVLLDEGVERPSDIDGLIYIPLDDAGWQLRLGRELRAAGIAVDLNRIA